MYDSSRVVPLYDKKLLAVSIKHTEPFTDQSHDKASHLSFIQELYFDQQVVNKGFVFMLHYDC